MCLLFFLFPDKQDASKAVQDFIQEDISIKQIHALARQGVNLDGLPVAAPNQRRDMHSKAEYSLWNSNLALFFIALFICIIAFLYSNYPLMFASLALMSITYLIGDYYLTKPTIHLSNFHAAFEHNEILLMVDVPKAQVRKIEQLMSHKNPSASEEGISWTPADLSMSV